MPLARPLCSFLAKTKAKWNAHTPCFVVRTDQLVRMLGHIKKHLPGEILYSLKTNPDPVIARMVAEAGCGFLLSSIEETERLLATTNVERCRLMFQSPSLTVVHFARLKALGVSRFIVDSASQLELILGSLEGFARKPELLVRVNTGVSARSPELKYSSDSFLGFPLAEVLPVFRRLGRLRAEGRLTLGLHNHLLSQNTSLALWRKNLATLAGFVAELLRQGIELDLVDFGGGYPIRYGRHPVPELATIAREVRRATARMRRVLPSLRVAFEPGRKVVGESISLVTRVNHVKRFLGTTVAILDCSLYNASLDTLIVDLHLPVERLGARRRRKQACVLRGSTPDSLDVFAQRVSLDLAAGDTVVFRHAGAYAFASDFIGLRKPEHIFT